jgi:hypothetical protein
MQPYFVVLYVYPAGRKEEEGRRRGNALANCEKLKEEGTC